MKLFSLTCILMSLLICKKTMAAELTGYKHRPESLQSQLQAPIFQFKETESDFGILLKHHAGVYHFPKAKDTAVQIRKFLTDRMRSKSPVQIQFDTKTAQIFSINDAP
jgi:hypothetical protein